MKPDLIGATAATDAVAPAGRCITTSAVTLEDFQTADLGLARQHRLAEELTCNQERVLLLWRAPSAVTVGRTDTRLRKFSDAVDRLRIEGWPVAIRRSGGGACPVSRGTLQIALARIALPDTTIDAAYIELTGIIRSVLESYGLKIEIGEQPDAFCPGRYDISVNDQKLAGLSQHWRRCNGRTTVTTAATLIVKEETGEIARIVNLFYFTAGSEKRCSAAAIGALRQDLPVHAVFEASLMDDLCNRIANAFLSASDRARPKSRKSRSARAGAPENSDMPGE
jgi:hypothetical protein